MVYYTTLDALLYSHSRGIFPLHPHFTFNPVVLLSVPQWLDSLLLFRVLLALHFSIFSLIHPRISSGRLSVSHHNVFIAHQRLFQSTHTLSILFERY